MLVTYINSEAKAVAEFDQSFPPLVGDRRWLRFTSTEAQKFWDKAQTFHFIDPGGQQYFVECVQVVLVSEYALDGSVTAFVKATDGIRLSDKESDSK